MILAILITNGGIEGKPRKGANEIHNKGMGSGLYVGANGIAHEGVYDKMRTLKFRQFVNGRFHYWGFLEKDCFTGPVNPRDPSQQFTGLFSKSGKDIFEGDIIKIESLSYGTFSAPIEYFRGRARFGAVTWTDKAKQVTLPGREWNRPHPPCGCDGAMYEAMSILDTHDTFAEKNERVEVIGNVYEGEAK